MRTESFLRAVSALNDETRVRFLKFLLTYGKSCVCEFEESFSMLQPRISRHLKILRDAGFLRSSKEGQRVYYALAPATPMHERLLDELMALDAELPEKVCACDIEQGRAS